MVAGSLRILKARRQALLLEFLAAVRPFLRSRRQIRTLFYRALGELRLALGDEGQDDLAHCRLSIREDVLAVEKRNILGVICHEVKMPSGIRRTATERHYDITATGPLVEEAADLFEGVAEAMLSLAVYETRVKRLGEEIVRVSRRARVPEEPVLPGLTGAIRSTGQYIGEREREEYFRLKKFKALHLRT